MISSQSHLPLQSRSPEDLQALYYEATSSSYDSMHTSDPDDEHFKALKIIDAISGMHNLTSFLDVGAGTGRGVRFLREKGHYVRGVEPVPALIRVAEASGVPQGVITPGNGYCLPFEDRSFDAVFECGVLHHVKEPGRVVSEMTRVAKRAVFLSDSNRFGQGSTALRLIKLGLYKTNLWNMVTFIHTKGKMYQISDGDGLFYSYSVFDSYAQLTGWADRLVPIATANSSFRSWFHPLLTAPSVLLCAFKSPNASAME